MLYGLGGLSVVGNGFYAPKSILPIDPKNPGGRAHAPVQVLHTQHMGEGFVATEQVVKFTFLLN